MAAADLTAARLREVLDYDPATGLFTWRVRASTKTKVGARAGTLNKLSGYRRIKIDLTIYQEHWLVFLWMIGVWPAHEVDHINGSKADNRWDNLRCVTRAVNLQNKRSAHANNMSGLLGAHFNRRTCRYSAHLVIGGVRHSLGEFATPHEAHVAYVKAKRLLHPGCTL